MVVRRQWNQIARGDGLLQGNTLLPGQRRCRSPALRAIGLRGRTVAGVAARDRLFGGRCRGLVIRWSGSRRKGLFARPAPHVTAGTLPGGLVGADACTIHGVGCGVAAEPDRPGGRAPTGKHPPTWAETLNSIVLLGRGVFCGRRDGGTTWAVVSERRVGGVVPA